MLNTLFSGVLGNNAELTEITISAKILWTGFGGIALLCATITVILLYHWVKYGYNPSKIGFMSTLYLAGVLALFGLFFLSILAYITSI